MENPVPPELQKTSAFGRFFFCLSMALLTIGIVAVISTVGRTLPEILDACVVGGLFFLPAFVCWYVGFRHDRPKLKRFYHNKQTRS
jgi:hypothetical protein